MANSALSPLPSALLAGVCALSVLGGCDVTISKDGDVSFDRLHGRASQEWNRKYPLTAGGTVEVTNANGTVEVVSGSAGTVNVAVVIIARAMTNERAKELLGEARIEESAAPGHVKLTTERGGRRTGGVEVNYKISVAPDTRVEVSSTNGTVKIDGLRGGVKAIMANGDVELTGLRGVVDAASVNGVVFAKMAEVTAAVRLESTNGRVALEVPKDTKAVLKALSVNGSITVTGLASEEASGRRIRNLDTVLNGGGPEIDVRVTNGRITIEGK